MVRTPAGVKMDTTLGPEPDPRRPRQGLGRLGAADLAAVFATCHQPRRAWPRPNSPRKVAGERGPPRRGRPALGRRRRATLQRPPAAPPLGRTAAGGGRPGPGVGLRGDSVSLVGARPAPNEGRERSTSPCCCPWARSGRRQEARPARGAARAGTSSWPARRYAVATGKAPAKRNAEIGVRARGDPREHAGVQRRPSRSCSRPGGRSRPRRLRRSKRGRSTSRTRGVTSRVTNAENRSDRGCAVRLPRDPGADARWRRMGDCLPALRSDVANRVAPVTNLASCRMEAATRVT